MATKAVLRGVESSPQQCSEDWNNN